MPKVTTYMIGKSVITAALVLAVAVIGAGEQGGAATPPKFEVAAVKPSANADQSPAERKRGWGYETGRVTLLHLPLRFIIAKAFDVQLYQIVGPDWIAREYFDYFAIVPPSAPKSQIPLMFQAMLAEKFQMKWHREVRASQVYALTVAQGGPKLERGLPNDGDMSVTSESVGSGSGIAAHIVSNSDEYGKERSVFSLELQHTEFQNITMTGLANRLSFGLLDLPVLDMTNLSGPYQVTLDIRTRAAEGPTPGQPGYAQARSDEMYESTRESLRKLGLKLARRNAPVEKLIIDRADKTPTND